MKHTLHWTMAALALPLLLAACADSQTAAQGEATSDEAVSAAAPAVEPGTDAVAPANAQDETPVAKIGDETITEGDIQKVLGLFMKQMGGRIPPNQMSEAMPRIRERIVEELIMRRIMLDEVAKAGITLSDSEFADIKSEMAEELPPGTTLEDYLAETGTSEAEMREQMAVRKMIMAKADAVAKPSDEEIKAFYDENKEGFAQDESVTASHILIKTEDTDDEAAQAAKLERIEGLRKQLLEGADFAELAKANSDCPSASSGGDLGSFGRGQMVPEFEDAAFAQEIGTVGEVVKTQFGYHLIKVTERKEAKALDFEEVKARVSDILYSQKQQDAVREYVDGLREAAQVERFDEPLPPETELDLDAEPEDVQEIELEVGEEPVMTDEVEMVVEEAAQAVEATADESAAAVEQSTEAPAEAVEPAAEAVAEPAVAATETVEETVEVVEEAVVAVEETIEPAAPASVESVPAVPEQVEEPVAEIPAVTEEPSAPDAESAVPAEEIPAEPNP